MMYIERENKSPEQLVKDIESGILQLGELPLSIRNKVQSVLDERKEKEDGKVQKASAKVPGEPEVKAKPAASAKKAAAKKSK